MHIYWYRALLALQSKRGGRRAARELRQAKRTARRLTRRQKQALPPGFFAYWEARANEAKGNKARATKAYLRILNKAPVSFYGLLAGQRLQRLGKLLPLPFAKDNHPALSWTPPTGTPTTKTLALVKQSGPAPLYLLELETRLLRNRNNLGLRIQVAAAAGHQPPLSDGLVWLHDVRKRFLHGTVPISRALLLAAFPKPDKRWPKWIKRARQHKLDSRLVAALLLHVRGFHPDTRRKTYTGPGNASLWLGPALSSPTTTFDEACRRLQQALQTYSSPGLAIDAVLTRRNTYLRHIKQTIPTSSADLHYPFLSQQTRDILQTYWIYKQLYLR
jgi:hypothetical protein